MGKVKPSGAMNLFPSSKFLHLMMLARGSSSLTPRPKLSRPRDPSTATLVVDPDSRSGMESPSSISSHPGTVAGSPSSPDLKLDDLLTQSEVNIPQASLPSDVAGPTSVSSPSKDSARLLADRIKDSSLLEELGTPTTHVSGAPFVLIPDDNLRSAKEEFKDFLFARFPGDVPAMGRIIGVINAIWARSGPRIFVHRVGQGTFILKVSNEKTRGILLSRQVWMIAGCPMYLAPWSPEFSSDQSQVTSAVVPVEFRGVPYLLFNRQSLSRIATAVGKPVSLAPETERKENFEVARVWIRVSLTSELPTKIISGYSNGRENEITVSYPWLPKKCEKCDKYRHDQHLCPSATSYWRKIEKDQSVGRTRSMESRARQRSRPGRSRRQAEKQLSTTNPRDDANVTHSGPQVHPGKGEVIVMKDSVSAGTANEITPTDTLEMKSDDSSPSRVVVGNWATEVENNPPPTDNSLIPKEPGPHDGNRGSSSESANHEAVVSPSNQPDDHLDDTEAPFFLVSSRKTSRKARKV